MDCFRRGGHSGQTGSPARGQEAAVWFRPGLPALVVAGTFDISQICRFLPKRAMMHAGFIIRNGAGRRGQRLRFAARDSCASPKEAAGAVV